MFYSVLFTRVAGSARVSDVEFEYIWHDSLNDVGLYQIGFVMRFSVRCRY